jgi:hypothetical protein
MILFHRAGMLRSIGGNAHGKKMDCVVARFRDTRKSRLRVCNGGDARGKKMDCETRWAVAPVSNRCQAHRFLVVLAT